MDKDPKRPVKLHYGGAVVFGCSALPRKKCRPPKKSIFEKGSGANNDVSDDVTGNMSPDSLPLEPGQRDHQQPPQPSEDGDDQASVQVSPSGVETQQIVSFEDECRAIAAALTQRHNRHETSVGLDDLIKKGRAIYEQSRQQA